MFPSFLSSFFPTVAKSWMSSHFSHYCFPTCRHCLIFLVLYIFILYYFIFDTFFITSFYFPVSKLSRMKDDVTKNPTKRKSFWRQLAYLICFKFCYLILSSSSTSFFITFSIPSFYLSSPSPSPSSSSRVHRNNKCTNCF